MSIVVNFDFFFFLNSRFLFLVSYCVMFARWVCIFLHKSMARFRFDQREMFRAGLVSHCMSICNSTGVLP